MYKKQTNPAALLSQNLISDALLRLMREQPFSQITVTQICTEAGVGRKTFYRNFEFKEDIIAFQLDALCALYEKELALSEYEKNLRYHFSFIRQHMDYLILLHQNGLLPMATAKFSVFLPDLMPTWSTDPVEQEYRSAYIVAGIDALLAVWLSRGFAESIDEMAALVERMHEKQLPIA